MNLQCVKESPAGMLRARRFARRAGMWAPARHTLAMDGGCRTKPTEKARCAFALVHARADLRDDLATDRSDSTDEPGDFGARP